MAKPKSAKKGRGRPPPPDSPLASDLEMPEDQFHKQRDKLALDIHDDVLSDDDSLDEEEVLGMEERNSEEDDDSDSEDEDTKYGRRECSSILV
jgi:hypothetical protein